ncbi:hypothetical protein H0H92_013502 [Tricholoma furcatifolium]|nr:hypothetical protein H0H92_013502 [Tricholoma furcatifolium]
MEIRSTAEPVVKVCKQPAKFTIVISFVKPGARNIERSNLWASGCALSNISVEFVFQNRMNPKVEGAIGSTPERMGEARGYIEEQIKAHQTIIRYYKRRLNALSITCRIPIEILGTILFQVRVDLMTQLLNGSQRFRMFAPTGER